MSCLNIRLKREIEMTDPKGTFTFRVDDEMKKKLEKLAEETGRSVGWLIRAAIIQYLEKYGPAVK